MRNRKSARAPVFKVIAVLLLSIILVFSIVINILFLKSDKPLELLGKIVFLMPSGQMETDNEDSIRQNSLIFADKYDAEITNNEVLAERTIVICYYTKNEQKYATISRVAGVSDENGKIFYDVKWDSVDADEEAERIPASDIIGVCKIESSGLGRVIVSVKSIWGIVLTLILPCAVLFLIMIIRPGGRRSLPDDDDSGFVYEPSPVWNKKAAENPLFMPDEKTNTDESFIAKKNSIAENFSQKKPVPNPPNKREIKIDDSIFETKTKSNIKSEDGTPYKTRPPVNKSRPAEVRTNTSLENDIENLIKPSPQNNSKDAQSGFSGVLNNQAFRPSDSKNEQAAAIKLALQNTVEDDAKQAGPQPEPVRTAPEKNNTGRGKAKRLNTAAVFDDLMDVINKEKEKLNKPK